MSDRVARRGGSHLAAMSLLSVLVLCCASCASSEKMTPIEAAEGTTWWNSPGEVKDYLAAVGVSPKLSELSVRQARGSAETDGRDRLCATLRARITSLSENWEKGVADLTNNKSFSSYLNDERMVRQFIDDEVLGAQTVKYREADGQVFALVVLRDPGEWAANLSRSWEANALKDETLFKTEVMRQDFRKRMDALRTEDQRKIKEKQEEFNEAIKKE